MQKDSLAFLENLLLAPSPSGYERPVQDVVRKYVESFADEVHTDWHGNVTAAINPRGSLRIMLAGHCDQIGLMVRHIDDRGFLWASTIGGWDIQMLIGQTMVIWTESGPIHGVIARKAVHLLTPEERKSVLEIKDLWIDIGASSGEEARKQVAIGDPVTFRLGMTRLQNNLAAAPGMDNKVGTWVVMEALKLIAERNPQAAVFSVSTVQEEIGLRGAKTSSYRIDPTVGIAVDVTHATDCPTVSAKEYGEVSLGKGPVIFRGPNVNPVVFEHLLDIGKTSELPIQRNSIGAAASNDANIMQTSRAGMATGIVAIPNRYMHSPVEVVSLDDLENASRLIADFCCRINKESDFTP